MPFVIIAIILFMGSQHIRAEIHPVFADGWVVAGHKTVGPAVRYMRIGSWDEAEQELRKTLGFRPRNHAAQFNLGICHERLGRIDAALTCYERAIALKPEYLYCEGLARIQRVAGAGAEFVKFLIPCDRACNNGFAFARSGLWREASNRFQKTMQHHPSPTVALNLAVTYEVIGKRTDALNTLLQATKLAPDTRYEAFSHYLRSTSQLPLDMLTALPGITTLTDSPVMYTVFSTRNKATIRLDDSHDSPVLAVIDVNTRLEVIHHSASWCKVRVFPNREGFIPTFFLNSGTAVAVKEDTDQSHESPVSHQNDPFENVEDHQEDMSSVKQVQVRADGPKVAIRREPSLLSDVSGHVEPGSCLMVKDSGDNHWLEITDGESAGYILKMYVTDVPESE